MEFPFCSFAETKLAKGSEKHPLWSAKSGMANVYNVTKKGFQHGCFPGDFRFCYLIYSAEHVRTVASDIRWIPFLCKRNLSLVFQKQVLAGRLLREMYVRKFFPAKLQVSGQPLEFHSKYLFTILASSLRYMAVNTFSFIIETW